MDRPLPIVAYLDTNIFHEIVERDSRGDGLQQRLQRGREEGKIALPASFIVTNEFVDGIGSGDERKSDRSIKQFRVQRDLGDWERIIKPVDVLAADEFRAFARGDPRPSSFFRDMDAKCLVWSLDEEFRDANKKSPTELAAQLREVVVKNWKQKETFADGMNEWRKEVLEMLRGRNIPSEHAKQIEELRRAFDDRVAAFAEHLVRRAGVLDECRTRGIERLLEQPSIKAGFGAIIALCWTRGVPVTGPTAEFQRGDSRDMQHVIAAAAIGTDVFVCRDKRLRDVVAIASECGWVDLKGATLDTFLEQIL